MSISWGSLFLVCVVSLAIGVAVVVLVSFALVGLSARRGATGDGPRGDAPVAAGTGTGIAAACLLAAAAIVGYGLWIIIS